MSINNQTPVHSEVPQGGIFGHFLFIMYINDIAIPNETNHFHFADDTKYVKSISQLKTACTLMQVVLSSSVNGVANEIQ